jgi:pimeloyl-ACP methyl ester carboxylesterase
MTAASTLATRLPITAGDLQGLSRLAVDGVVGMTDIVEAMHLTIGARAGLLRPGVAGRAAGLTGLAYGSVRGVTRLVGRGLQAVLPAARMAPGPTHARRLALVSALNGVWGDHLERTNNPLALPMSLRIAGQPWREAVSAPTGRLLVLVHGLGMNDLQWQRNGHDHGRMLAAELGFSPVYLRYNSGRHVSQNGRDFAERLASLVADWPVPVDELVIVGHSMGGLVARSACASGAGSAWMTRLSTLVFLGTPHHGAPLERGGRLVDAALEFSPYAAPLARLGKARSAGITDLRFGNLHDADWQHRDRHAQTRDDRVPVPLPAGVRCCFVAATKGETSTGLRSTLVGDGLVPLASALGEHADPARTLKVPRRQQLVVTSAHHWDLLDRAEVRRRLVAWLA